ncbi:hypothetical protein ACLOJK_034870 [Asimina triloba]
MIGGMDNTMGAMLAVGDGEDDVLAMIIMMGGLDRSIQALVVPLCRHQRTKVAKATGSRRTSGHWQRGAGEHRGIGSEVQASSGGRRQLDRWPGSTDPSLAGDGK